VSHTGLGDNDDEKKRDKGDKKLKGGDLRGISYF